MTEPSCPRCKTTKYTNPSLHLMVNVCGHALCEVCVQTLFVQGSGKCYECSTVLRRANFRSQLFEDAMVERDVDVRRKILKEFNKTEEDFATLKEYNSYLEFVETIIYNVVNHLNQEWTNKQIEDYRATHQDEIKRNRSKVGREVQELNDWIEEERAVAERNRQLVQLEAEQSKMRKVKQKDELINELMLSDRPAEHIIQTHREMSYSNVPACSANLNPPSLTQLPPPTSTATSLSSRSSFNRLNKLTDNNQIRVPLKATDRTVSSDVTPVLFTYQPLTFDFLGPNPPTSDTIKKYLPHVRQTTLSERAGGYKTQIACERALQDAFSGLYFTSTDHQHMSVDLV